MKHNNVVVSRSKCLNALFNKWRTEEVCMEIDHFNAGKHPLFKLIATFLQVYSHKVKRSSRKRQQMNQEKPQIQLKSTLSLAPPQ